jgi:hypothetical protein
MDPSTQPSLADLIMSRGNAIILEHNGIRIVAARPLQQPIETDENNVTRFKRHNWNADMALSGMNEERASIHLESSSLINATFEIRDMNISISGIASLRSCNLTLINCLINASCAAIDWISIQGRSHLKFVGCEVNNCRIAADYRSLKSDRKTYEFSNCNFSYKDPLAVFCFLDTMHSNVILNECKLPRLYVKDSSTIEAHSCTFKQIALTKASRGKFIDCKLEEEVTNVTNKNNAILTTESKGSFIHCQIKWLMAHKSSKASITDSPVESVTGTCSSLIEMKNSTIKSKGYRTTIASKSTLNAHDLTIELLPITAGENLYGRLAPVKIESSMARFTGNLKFVFEENISETRLDINIDESTVLFPKTINANLLPRLFATGSQVFYPKGFRIDVPRSKENEFHKILMGSLFPGEWEAIDLLQKSLRAPKSPAQKMPYATDLMYTSRRSALLFGKPGKNIRINCLGRLFLGSSVTLDDMSKDEIAFAKSLIPSRAFLTSKGVKISKELMNDINFFTPPFYKVRQDICSICHELDSPCDTVATPCGHVYHEECYRSMLSFYKKEATNYFANPFAKPRETNCAICEQNTSIINIYK